MPPPLQQGPLLKVAGTFSNRPGQRSRSQSPGQQPSTGGFRLAGPPRNHACLEPRFCSSLAKSTVSLPRAFSGETHLGLPAPSQCRGSIHRMSRGYPGSACIFPGRGDSLLYGQLCQCRRHKSWGFDPWVEKVPLRRAWQPTPVFLPGEFHQQKSLVGYSP